MTSLSCCINQGSTVTHTVHSITHQTPLNPHLAHSFPIWTQVFSCWRREVLFDFGLGQRPSSALSGPAEWWDRWERDKMVEEEMHWWIKGVMQRNQGVHGITDIFFLAYIILGQMFDWVSSQLCDRYLQDSCHAKTNTDIKRLLPTEGLTLTQSYAPTHTH